MVDRDRRDPVEAAADGRLDLYDVATWEERTSLDGLATAVYWFVTRLAGLIVLLLAIGILYAIGGFRILGSPGVITLTLLSVLPALALAGYVWRSDMTSSEPLYLLILTFVLGMLTANFAAVVNSISRPLFQPLGFLGTVLFFYLVVGPIEETVKLLAVWLFAYHSDHFDAVIDGAVYGAMAGLGFATIENALYITQNVGLENLDFGLGLIGVGGGITALRALAGPGHVIYSAFAGYYLGLAKFNPENRGPIIVKGLIIAAFIHGTYNSTVSIVSGLLVALTPLPPLAAFFAYVLVYDGFFGYLLYRKIRRYRNAYWAAHDGMEPEDPSVLDTGAE
jgi:RsiW-degrading membrane proteinase PrsW (M82 family)